MAIQKKNLIEMDGKFSGDNNQIKKHHKMSKGTFKEQLANRTMSLHDRKFPRMMYQHCIPQEVAPQVADVKTDIGGVKTDIEGATSGATPKAFFKQIEHSQKASLHVTSKMSNNNNTAIHDLAADVADKFNIDPAEMTEFTGKFLDEQKNVPKKKKVPKNRCCARVWQPSRDGSDRCHHGAKSDSEYCGSHETKVQEGGGSTPLMRVPETGRFFGLFLGRYDEYQPGTPYWMGVPPFCDENGVIQFYWEHPDMAEIADKAVVDGATIYDGPGKRDRFPRRKKKSKKVPGKKTAGKVPAKHEESAQKLAEAFGVELPDFCQEFSEEVKDAIAEENGGKMDFPPKKSYIIVTKKQKDKLKKKVDKANKKKAEKLKKKEAQKACNRHSVKGCESHLCTGPQF
tara:strand:+ start:175 stop:1371 length:1197 start_codon:yes stop_codon:yes gene_type:complete